jgi:hypothetical protein
MDEERSKGDASTATDALRAPEVGLYRRRGLLVSAAGGIVTLTSRKALAARCSVSAAGSMNPSHYDETCSGYSAGWWKSHTSAWPRGFVAGKSDDDRDRGSDHGPKATCWSDVFGGATRVDKPEKTLLDALDRKLTPIGASGGGKDLPAQCVAALLNAAQFGPEAFGYDVAGIISLIQRNWGFVSVDRNAPKDLASMLRLLNNRDQQGGYRGDWRGRHRD